MEKLHQLADQKVSAIILAGGQGQRFHGKKQFTLLNGKQMWEYPYAEAVSILGPARVKVVGVDIPGGSTRTQSVINGIDAVEEDTERIVILEAARPLVRVKDLWQLILDDHPSATFVRALVNTVVFRDGTYINRNELYELLTPQAFDYPLLRAALHSGSFTDMTDETRVMFEYYNIQPHFIETDSPLFKVTYPEDICIAESMMNHVTEGC